MNPHNQSGYTGVCKHVKANKWRAQITFKGKTYAFGTFDRPEDSVKAHKRGEEMHDDFLEWHYSKCRKEEKAEGESKGWDDQQTLQANGSEN